MKTKNASRNLWPVLCLIAVAGCDYEIADSRYLCNCPEGQVCDESGACGQAEDLCGGLFCVDGVCVDGQCQGQLTCSDMNCPPDKTCVNAKCIDNACLDANNVEIDCGDGKTCSNGKCIDDACLDANNVEKDCGTGKTCSNGKCIDDACLDANNVEKDCGTGKTCSNGKCIDDECLDANNVEIDCGDGKTCSGGKCIDDECIEDGVPVTCEPGFECVKGDCTKIDCTGAECPCEGDDCPGTDVFIITPTSIETDEAGKTGTLEIALSSEPTADVEITITISKPGEATTDTEHITIPKSDWDQPISVIIAGVADHIIDGDQSYDIIITSTSDDPDFNQTVVIPGLNKDTDSAGFTYVFKSSPSVHESTDSKVEIEVALTSKPSAPVEIYFTSTDDTEIALETAVLTINPDDWNSPHVITVTGVPDFIVDGDQNTPINLVAKSDDPNFENQTDNTLTVKTIDDDIANLVVISSATVLSENGGTGSFDIVLSSKPQFPVTVNLSSSDITALEIDGPTVITIMPDDWDKPVTVNFKAVDDKLTDGTQSALINIVTASGDDNYNGIETSTPYYSITDDEQASIVLAASSSELKPGDYSSTVMVQLSSEPTAPVTVTLVTGNPDLLHPETTTLVFTPENWNVGQPVTVGPTNMSSAESSISTVQLYGTGASACNSYNGLTSNVLDYLIYAYGVHEYTYTSDTDPMTCIIIHDSLLPGTYKLQAWGASGGDEVGLDQTTGSHAGLGGYAEGILSLDEKTDIVIHVGSQGKAGTKDGFGESAVGGGCNGGGGGKSSAKSEALGFGGGGASDIRIGGDTYYHRVIVAGGGGGADDGKGAASGKLGGDNDGSGGAGGGLEGKYGYVNGKKSSFAPGTQDSGYAFGKGQPAGASANTSESGGGGGGWFGGHCGVEHNDGGSGGSGYVYTSTSYVVDGYELDPKYQLTDAKLISGEELLPSTSDNGEDLGHKGDGFVRITLISYQ